MKIKYCIKCKREFEYSPKYFYYRNKSRGWLSSWCKDCRKKNRIKTIKRELLLQKLRRVNSPCKLCGTHEKLPYARYCNLCKLVAMKLKKKKDKCIYKSRLRKATPKWVDRKDIRLFYDSCPSGFHVDHIVPIRGKNVCGLHTIDNLQYLTIKDNILKSNHFEEVH